MDESTRLTTGEKMIWAAVFAEALTPLEPNPRLTVEEACDYATSAIIGLRYKIGLKPDIRAEAVRALSRKFVEEMLKP